MDCQIELTDEAIAQLRDRVRPYARRNADVPETAGKNIWWDSYRADSKKDRDLFEALSPEQQAGVVRDEDIIAAHDERAEQKRKAREAMDSRAEHLRCAEVRLRDADYRLVCRGELVVTPAIKSAREWYANPREACGVVSGGCGDGKTIAAVDLIANHRGDALFLDADDACKAFSAHFGDQYKVTQDARNTGLLVLDDVGSEVDAARMMSVLTTLHNSRKSARSMPWLITTNLNQRDFAARYSSERLLSRMQQSVWMGVSGPDLRKGMR